MMRPENPDPSRFKVPHVRQAAEATFAAEEVV